MLKRSIFIKILILIISLSFILGISIFFVALREASQSLEQALIEESKLFSQIVAKDIEAGYLVHILKSKSLTEIIPFEEILFLWIVQSDAKIYFADNPKMVGKEVKDSAVGTKELIIKEIVFQETGEKIKLLARPLDIGIEEGDWTLFMGVSLESVRAARQRLILVSSASFSLALIFFILISFFWARKVIKPIKKLEKGVMIIGKGDLDHQIEINTGDEIEELGNAFNLMTRDLKKQYMALEGEKNKTLAIIDNFSDGILLLDKNNKILLINPKAESFFKFNRKNSVGKPISEFFKITSFKPLAESLNKERKKEFFRQEFKISENLVLEMSTVPVMIGRERLGTLVILHNITREKLIDKMKSEFVSLAAHQLRTPLSAIKWTIRIILDEELGKINKEQREFLEGSYQSNERMIYLINDLLSVARIEEGRFLYELSLTDIEELIESIIDSFKSEAERKKIKLEFSKPVKKIVKIILDSKKIKMVIENLIDNALRYNHHGGEVVISLKQGKKEIEVSIKDNGIGILAVEQPRIFSKFFRGAEVMKMDTEGNGLGLYIAKNIIEAHKGKIWFESVEGKGTTFYFILPIRKKV